MPPSLRLFPGPDGHGPNGSGSDDADAPRAAVPLGDLLAVAAAHRGRAWLEDFAAERVLVSADLADVLFAAKAMHVGPAGSSGGSTRRAA